MIKSTDIQIKEAQLSVQEHDYRTPIKFGGRVVKDVLVVDVEIQVESRDGKQATGRGSMPMGNVWAWPTSNVTGELTLQAMQRFAQAVVDVARDWTEHGHPLELTHSIAGEYAVVADRISQDLSLAEPMPRLAQLVAASPLEAAIHDAYGILLQQNSYNVLGPEYANTDLAHYLSAEFSGEYLDRYTLRAPKPTMPIYHLVGALDPIFPGDIDARINDGLPETLGEWIKADGLTHLKIKLNGDDLKWDVDRVGAIERAAAEAQSERGCTEWVYSLDFNEKCSSVEYVLEFLEQVKQQSPMAFERAQYIEQPTHRDLRANPENRMHEAAKIKPVVIDESLVDFESLLLAREQGYSGVALKACKGHTEALLMGAAAQKYNMFLCVQDLTCIGASFLHSASLSARLPTIAAIEGNGRQYCPVGNQGWEDRYPTMFDINDGTVGTAALSENGLGFSATR